MKRLAFRTLSLTALLCSTTPACNGTLVVSDGATTTTTCTGGRVVKLVVDKSDWGGMHGATFDGNAGYLLYKAMASNSSIVPRVDAEGNVVDRLTVPSRLGPYIGDVVPMQDGGAILSGAVDTLSGTAAWAAKVGAEWNLEWERTFEYSTRTSGAQLARLPDQGVIAAGLTGDLDQGSEPPMAYFSRISALGDVLWERKAPILRALTGGPNWRGRMLTVSPDNRIRTFLVTDAGVTLLESTLDGVMTEHLLDLKLALWPSDSVALPDGRLVTASTRASGAVLSMITADGRVEWEKVYRQGQGEAVAYNAARNEILLGGSYRGSDNLTLRTWIVATDLDGNQTWELVRAPIEINIDGKISSSSTTKGPPITDIAVRPDGSFIATCQTPNLSFFLVGAEPCAG